MLENQDGYREILRKHRKNLGVSQKELATMAGISPSTLANFEIRKFNLSVDSLENVRKALLKLAKKRESFCRAMPVALSFRGEVRAA
jgi:transcriptional regulator with XRE-family HTH domain